MNLVHTQRNHTNALETALAAANRQMVDITRQCRFYRQQNAELTRQNLDLANIAANRRADNIELAADATTLAEGLARVVMDSREVQRQFRESLGVGQMEDPYQIDAEHEGLEEGEIVDEQVGGAEVGGLTAEEDEEVNELVGAWHRNRRLGPGERLGDGRGMG